MAECELDLRDEVNMSEYGVDKIVWQSCRVVGLGVAFVAATNSIMMMMHHDDDEW